MSPKIAVWSNVFKKIHLFTSKNDIKHHVQIMLNISNRLL